MPSEFVSILMLTHNAPSYVETSVRSAKLNTEGVDFELVVLDNASDQETCELLERLYSRKLIDKLKPLGRNSLFAEGNNLAAEMASRQATHFLLLNSDIETKDPRWLRNILDIHKRGITAYGFAEQPDRVDGYCLLIDADLYLKYRLDEGHQWWWAVTKLQAQVLCADFSVQGYAEHEQFIHHFGGKSGNAFKNAKGMNVTPAEVAGWFGGRAPVALDRMADGSLPGRGPIIRPSLARCIARKLRSLLR